ncbi:MAG TPA: Smr/MutS family protein [Candidatus Gallacutalibacter stercoravium]|nr:Smr/MutS family protein [Candidatus Gallacutalibacter stercoravium]
MLERRIGFTLEVDIHGMKAAEAKRQLELLLSRAAPNIKEIVVIHGYHGGKVLQDMVRKDLKHARIQSKMLSLNSGQTILILKPPSK